MIDRELGRVCGLQYILDALEPMSPFGAELLRRPSFYDDEASLRLELRRVSLLMETPALAEAGPTLDRELMGLKDVRGSLARCGRGGTLQLTELFELKGLLLTLSRLRPLYERVCPLPGLAFSESAGALAVLDPRGEGRRSFTIEDAATPRLLAVRREKRTLEAKLYQTDDDAERASLRLRRDAVCALEDAEERVVCAELSGALAPFCAGLLHDCSVLGALDLLLRKASMGARFGATVPELRDGDLVLEEMTNPELVHSLAGRGTAFVPVSVTLSRGAAVITGANMGGKTVALKTLAQNVLLAMAGFPVCAARASLPFLRSLRFLSGDAEAAERGLSSFGGEVVRLREALELHGRDTLLLLDEPARGTNPDEGAAIVRGVVAWLERAPGFAVVATHYDGVAPQAGRHYRIVGLRDMDAEAVRRELAASGAPGPEVIARHMDYGLYPCPPDESCPREALAICRLLGLPEAVMDSIAGFYAAAKDGG